MAYPTSIWPGLVRGALMSDPDVHSKHHDDTEAELIATQTELGTTPSGSFGSVRARLDAIEAGTTGTISPINANFTIDAPSTVLLLSGGLVVATTSIRKVAGGTLTPPGPIATIPAGFRPGATTETPQVLLGTAIAALVNIEAGGNVVLHLIEGGGTLAAGGAITFQATWRM